MVPLRALLPVAALAAVLAVSSCGSGSPVPTDPGTGAVHGIVGPGAPPSGYVPAELEVVFSREGEQVRTTAGDGEYELELPAGTWDVRTADGKACATGVAVHGATRSRLDLSYPADCPS